MVVPITNNSSKMENKRNTAMDINSNMERISGNGKKIIVKTNSKSLLVVGCGNSVEIDKNEGKVEIIGDGCTLSVNSGSGLIKYTGDGGCLKTGNVDLKNIVYEGDGGRIVSVHPSSKKSHTTKSVKNVFISDKCCVKIPNIKNNSCISINIPVPIVKIRTVKCDKCEHQS